MSTSIQTARQHLQLSRSYMKDMQVSELLINPALLITCSKRGMLKIQSVDLATQFIISVHQASIHRLQCERVNTRDKISVISERM